MKVNGGRVLLLVALCVCTLAPVFGQDREAPVMGRIKVNTDAETRAVSTLGLDLMEYRDGSEMVFLTTRAELDRLAAEGWKVRIDVDATAALPLPGAAPETYMGGYRTVEETYAFLNQTQAQYPNLCQVFSYGQSWDKVRNSALGYDLMAVRLTSNVRPLVFKPTFFLQGGIHARELVPPELATRFIQYLLSNYGLDADATWLLDDQQIVVVPIINPDGRKIAETGQLKRKNNNNLTGGCFQPNTGIDLNRNYSFDWGTVNRPSDPPCGETWPGLTASSEPETVAGQALIASIFPHQRPGHDRTTASPLDATGVTLDMHSTGNLMLYPWGEDNLPPPNLQLRTIMRKCASYNGYNPIQTIQLYPTSGTSQDWTYGELGVAGFGMETGLGSGSCGGFMPPYSCLDGGSGGNFWNLNRPVLLYLAKLARTPFMTGEGPNAETLTVSRAPGLNMYSFRAEINDVNNGNNNVTGAELYVDTPPWRGGTPIAMLPEDGDFNSPLEYAIATIATPPGRHMIYVRGRDAVNWGAVRAIFTPTKGVNADFDGDRRTDISVYRGDTGFWYMMQSSNNSFRASQFGTSGDRLVPQDYDGDGKTDLAVYRGGVWYILRSATSTFSAITFGVASDIPVPADYDGDDKADIAVYRDGIWYYLKSSDGSFQAVQFGAAGDKPVPGDYDGDGRIDFAVYRPSVGVWYELRSTEGFNWIRYGISTDLPVPADYDADGKTDVAVFRDGVWYVRRSSGGEDQFIFGQAGDIPVPGDYDGDGTADAAVYRNGTWYLRQSTSGFATSTFGLASDQPVPNAYFPQ
jgi:carboxypeptidase T